MNILLVGYIYGKGGIQTHTHYLATGLAQRGHRVVVATPRPMHRHPSNLPTSANYTITTYAAATDLRHVNFDGESKIDVAVVCGTGWKAMSGILGNRNIRKRVFFEVMSGQRTGWRDPRLLVHAGFDAVVGQGKPVTERFCNEFMWRGKTATIPALPEPLERNHTIPPRSKLPISLDGRLRLGYFGRLARHKGVAFLIEKWPILSRYANCLDIHGGGDQLDELERMIAARGLTDSIRLCGPYPDGAAYIALMQSYDLTLLPTVGAEGAPLVLLEAMACGTPFVANGVGGIPDYANPDCAVTSGNINEFWPAYEALAIRIRDGSIEPRTLQTLYDACYSFEALTQRWETFLSELAGAKIPATA